MYDLQFNGLSTKNFSCDFWNKPEPEAIDLCLKYLFEQGVKKILATIITDDPEHAYANLKTIFNYKNSLLESKKLLQTEIAGVHVEGGYISRLGVHPANFARAFDYQFARKIIQDFPNLIKLWTLCPNIDRDGSLTTFLQDKNILVSYGHSNATYQEAMLAFQKYKVNLVTHWGNAMYVMKNFHQRKTSDQELWDLDNIDVNLSKPEDIGLGLAAYRHPEVYCMAIAGSDEDADLHLDPRLLKHLANKKLDKFILVSDCVAYNGPSPNNLVGGLNTLAQHKKNALIAGLEPKLIENALNANIEALFTE
jgi:N-acetylglucosamine-6-phosphate deacetylase